MGDRIKSFLAVFILLLCFSDTVFSQSLFSINGTVKNKKGEPIEAATVFLSGSSQATRTNEAGKFTFTGLSSGSYEVVIRMLGYSSLKENALINSQSINKMMVLSQKNIQLKEVQIGKSSKRDDYLKTFFDTFIGVTKNAAFCTIVNPEVIEFSTNGRMLKAYSDEFIIVRNKSLGYKISFLLRDFIYDSSSAITIYDGECIFEKLNGTLSQEKKWEKNRLQAYNGSFMHFLRSLYVGNSAGEGFLTYIVDHTKKTATDSLIDVKQYISKANGDFRNFSFDPQLKVVYAGKLAVKGVPIQDFDPFKRSALPTSYVKLFVYEAVIDKKGSYVDYKSFRLEGLWGVFRLGDQLPFEYMPSD